MHRTGGEIDDADTMTLKTVEARRCNVAKRSGLLGDEKKGAPGRAEEELANAALFLPRGVKMVDGYQGRWQELG